MNAAHLRGDLPVVRLWKSRSAAVSAMLLLIQIKMAKPSVANSELVVARAMETNLI